ncbi:MAG: MqnA/MqnD/SBP family protein [Elusimicrobiota bacterium]
MEHPSVIGRVRSAPAQLYYNNLKFFGSYVTIPVSAGVLADLVLRGRIMAGPVAAGDLTRLLQEGCEELADFGIFINPYKAYAELPDESAQAAINHAPYVMLTRRPIEEHGRLKVGISEEILSLAPEAAVLAKLLLSFYWEMDHEISSELSLEDDVWVCQGGPYLGSRSRQFFGFSYAYDLAWEWYRWKRAPFCLYRWVCQPGLERDQKDELISVIRRTLELNLRNLSQMAAQEASLKGLERGEVLDYLQCFGFRLDLWRESAQNALCNLVSMLKESEIFSLSPRA